MESWVKFCSPQNISGASLISRTDLYSCYRHTSLNAIAAKVAFSFFGELATKLHPPPSIFFSFFSRNMEPTLPTMHRSH